MSENKYCPTPDPTIAESLRLEAVTTCVGFDDVLDETIPLNHPQFDSLIVVTSHDDRRTHQVCNKHGVTCVQSDLFKKNGRNFNKGAAVNAGFNRFQFHGWRVHMDCDVVLPANARRVLMNHTHLDTGAIYAADRIDVIGKAELRDLWMSQLHKPQHQHGCLVNPGHHRSTSPRYMDNLRGFVPIGFFQMWHASTQKPYPYSLGTAAHDDVMFGEMWPQHMRRLLPTLFLYHLCAQPPKLGENWDGKIKQPRLDGGKR